MYKEVGAGCLYAGKFKNSSEADKPWPDFTEQSPSIKPLAGLPAKLSLKHMASLGKVKQQTSVIVSFRFKGDILSQVEGESSAKARLCMLAWQRCIDH